MGLKRRPPQGDTRRVISMGQNLRGVITNKTGCTVQFESFAERTLLLLFERDRTVLNYRSQPEIFEFTDQEKKARKYTPDFKVWRTDGSIEIHEVTRQDRQEQLRIRERERGAKILCEARHWKYIVHTEHTLPKSTEVANLLALLRYRIPAYAHDAVTASAKAYLQQNGAVQVQKCLEYVTEHLDIAEPIAFATLCHLLWHEELSTHLQHLLIVENAFAPQAQIWLPADRKEEG
jgi:hypothetical protein